MTSPMPDLNYPVLLWREGYTYLAAGPLELCVHPRSLFDDTLLRAREGQWQIVDGRGRSFKVADWIRGPAFGGVRSIPFRLLRSVFAVPVLSQEADLSLPDFKKKLTAAIRSRYRHDGDKGPGAEAIRKLRHADSYESALAALPRL